MIFVMIMIVIVIVIVVGMTTMTGKAHKNSLPENMTMTMI